MQLRKEGKGLIADETRQEIKGLEVPHLCLEELTKTMRATLYNELYASLFFRIDLPQAAFAIGWYPSAAKNS